MGTVGAFLKVWVLAPTVLATIFMIPSTLTKITWKMFSLEKNDIKHPQIEIPNGELVLLRQLE